MGRALIRPAALVAACAVLGAPRGRLVVACVLLTATLGISGCRRAVTPAPPAVVPAGEVPPAPGPQPVPAPAPAPGGEPEPLCPPLWGAPAEAGTIRLGLPEAVDPAHAPVPRNDAERLVFRQCYETLVQADRCGGLQPGLAVQWRSRDGGRTWEFELREDARLWDGTALDRSAIRRAWASRRRCADADESYYPWSWIAGISELDPDGRTLTVALTTPLPGPDLFLHPALAVALDDPPSPWPLGSGPFRPEPIGTDARSLVRLVLHPYHPAGQGGGPTWPAPLATTALEAPSILILQCSPGADPRDLLAQGADVVWMRSLREVEYAGLTRGYDVTALPWDRIYGVAADSAAASRLLGAAVPRDALAAEAADSPARPAEALAFARLEPDAADSARSGADGCGAWALPPPVSARASGPAPPGRASAAGGLLFDGADRDAARLAERLVALSLVTPASTTPAAGDALRAAAATPGAPPCVVRLGRVCPDACLEPLALWRPDSLRPVVPLVAVRAHLVTRHGLGGIAVAWDGTPVFAAAGWGAPPRGEGDGP